MPRPSKPLISRAATVTASLEIIDSEGLEAFGLPRLAKHLGVRPPSLYHHFSDRSEILSAVAHEIIGATPMPRRRPGPDWPEYFVTFGSNLRRSVLRHRNAAPILLQHLPHDTLTERYEEAAAFLEASGVPARLHIRILLGVERLALGAALVDAVRRPGTGSALSPRVDPATRPTLARALAENEATSGQLFEEMLRNFLRGTTADEIESV